MNPIESGVETADRFVLEHTGTVVLAFLVGVPLWIVVIAWVVA